MAVGIIADHVRHGSRDVGWCCPRGRACVRLGVCTLPIDKALHDQRRDDFRLTNPSRTSTPHACSFKVRRVTTEKPDRRVPGGLRIGAFL